MATQCKGNNAEGIFLRRPQIVAEQLTHTSSLPFVGIKLKYCSGKAEQQDTMEFLSSFPRPWMRIDSWVFAGIGRTKLARSHCMFSSGNVLNPCTFLNTAICGPLHWWKVNKVANKTWTTLERRLKVFKNWVFHWACIKLRLFPSSLKDKTRVRDSLFIPEQLAFSSFLTQGRTAFQGLQSRRWAMKYISSHRRSFSRSENFLDTN